MVTVGAVLANRPGCIDPLTGSALSFSSAVPCRTPYCIPLRQLRGKPHSTNPDGNVLGHPCRLPETLFQEMVRDGRDCFPSLTRELSSDCSCICSWVVAFSQVAWFLQMDPEKYAACVPQLSSFSYWSFSTSLVIIFPAISEVLRRKSLNAYI